MEATLPRSFTWVLRLFSFLLDLRPAQLYEEVLRVERRLFSRAGPVWDPSGTFKGAPEPSEEHLNLLRSSRTFKGAPEPSEELQNLLRSALTEGPAAGGGGCRGNTAAESTEDSRRLDAGIHQPCGGHSR